MARHEQDREDILREATALVERVELRLSGCDEPVVVGFRRDGAASFFFGAEEVFQFNAARQLRRGYRQGRLVKADRGRLASLERQRSTDEVVLLRHDMSDEETAEFLAAVARRLAQLAGQLESAGYAVVGQVPVDANLVPRIRTWLESLGQAIEIARRPNLGPGK